MTSISLVYFFLFLTPAIHHSLAAPTTISSSDRSSTSEEVGGMDSPLATSSSPESNEAHQVTQKSNHNSHSENDVYIAGSRRPFATQPNEESPANFRAKRAIQSARPNGRRWQLGRSAYYYGNQNPYMGYPGPYMYPGTGNMMQNPYYMYPNTGLPFFQGGAGFPSNGGTAMFPYQQSGVPNYNNPNQPFFNPSSMLFSSQTPQQIQNGNPPMCPFLRKNKSGICNQTPSSESNTEEAASENENGEDVNADSGDEAAPDDTSQPPENVSESLDVPTPNQNMGMMTYINGQWYFVPVDPNFTGRSGEKE